MHGLLSAFIFTVVTSNNISCIVYENAVYIVRKHVDVSLYMTNTRKLAA